jgi:type II secretory pathway component PulC
MRSVKAANGLLWLANVAVGAGIVVFAFQYLIFPQDDNPLADVEEDASGATGGGKPKPVDYSPVKLLPNPVEPRERGSGPTARPDIAGELLGTVSSDDPDQIVAFLLVPGKNQHVNAYYKEPVTLDGAPIEEFRGWTLVRVTRDTAVFTNGAKETTLTIRGTLVSAGPASGAPPSGTMIDRSQVKLTKLQAGNDREVYGIDRQSIEWIMANQDQVLSEVGLTDYSGGGIQITSLQSGSIAEAAGLQQSDVIKSINGQPIKNSISLAELRNNEQLRKSGSMTISLERAGQVRSVVIQPTQR